MMTRILFAALIAGFVLAHGLAMDKIHAMDGSDRLDRAGTAISGD